MSLSKMQKLIVVLSLPFILSLQASGKCTEEAFRRTMEHNQEMAQLVKTAVSKYQPISAELKEADASVLGTIAKFHGASSSQLWLNVWHYYKPEKKDGERKADLAIELPLPKEGPCKNLSPETSWIIAGKIQPSATSGDSPIHLERLLPTSCKPVTEKLSGFLACP